MPLACAGTEIYVHTLATMQKSYAHEVAVITPHIDYYRPGKIDSHYMYEWIDVYQFLETGNPKDKQVHYGKKKPAGLDNFKQLIVTLEPDVIHFHELNRSIGFTTEHVKIARQYGSKVFLTMHLSSYTCNTNILVRDGKICDGKIREMACTECCYKTNFKLSLLLAKPLTALSVFCLYSGITGLLGDGKATTLMMIPTTIKRVKNELKELVQNLDQFICYAKWYEKILIENGVPNNKITIVPEALVTVKKYVGKKLTAIPALPLKMVFVGRIQQTKGIHLVIEAMQQFSAQQVQIDLYGRPEETAYYSKCFEDSLGYDNINWKGEIDRGEVLACLAQYDIFCLASTFSEMSPLVIQEAFSVGLPVLASKVYGNIEQVTDGYNGMLFEFNSSKSLAQKIKELVNNPWLVQQMKNNVEAPLHFEEVNAAYLDLYTS